MAKLLQNMIRYTEDMVNKGTAPDGVWFTGISQGMHLTF